MYFKETKNMNKKENTVEKKQDICRIFVLIEPKTNISFMKEAPSLLVYLDLVD